MENNYNNNINNKTYKYKSGNEWTGRLFSPMPFICIYDHFHEKPIKFVLVFCG